MIHFKPPIHPGDSNLETDPVHGMPALHPDARAMLEFIDDFCKEHGLHDPVVTCIGRTRADQEALYAPGRIQQLENHGVREWSAKEQARQMARAQFSWHCVAKPELRGRAFDLRSVFNDKPLYSHDEAQLIMAEVLHAWPHAEVLHHAIQGNQYHFHFGSPNPLGKPFDWL